MSVGSWTRCESNTFLMWYYSRHKQVSENEGECLCERRRSGTRPYYRDSACGSSRSRVPRSKTRAHLYTSILYQKLGMNQITFKDQTLITFIVYLHMSITSGFTLLVTSWDIMVLFVMNMHFLTYRNTYNMNTYIATSMIFEWQ